MKKRIETEIEGKKAMPYLASFERVAMEKGRQEGRQEGREEGLKEAVRLGLKLRFGDAGLALLPGIGAIRDPERLQSLVTAVERVQALEEFKTLLEANRGSSSA